MTKMRTTGCELEDFSVIQILCEIKVGESTQSVLPLERIFKSALNFDFHEFLYFLKTEIYQNNNIDPVMFGVHQEGKLLIQTRTKTKQSSSRLDKELSPMVDIRLII